MAKKVVQHWSLVFQRITSDGFLDDATGEDAGNPERDRDSEIEVVIFVSFVKLSAERGADYVTGREDAVQDAQPVQHSWC